MIICIDFDGTIVTNKWPEIGEPLPGALEAIRALYKAGHKIVINTCRSGKPEWAAKEWLALNHVPYDAFNENLPEQIRLYGSDCRKLSGDVYIDDKNLGGFPGWEAVLNSCCMCSHANQCDGPLKFSSGCEHFTIIPDEKKVSESLCAFAAQCLCISGYKCDSLPSSFCASYRPRVSPTHREPCGKVVKDELCEKCPTLKRYSCGVPEVQRNYGPSCANCEVPDCPQRKNDNVLCGRWRSTAPVHPGCDLCSRKPGCDSVFRADNCPDWRPVNE